VNTLVQSIVPRSGPDSCFYIHQVKGERPCLPSFPRPCQGLPARGGEVPPLAAYCPLTGPARVCGSLCRATGARENGPPVALHGSIARAGA
jgi:hypothetical protein